MLNLTQHKATSEQLAAGVMDLNESIAPLLTFDTMPTVNELSARAVAIAEVASKYGLQSAMIGGAPYFMPYLVTALKARGIKPYYAFSQRVSSEHVNEAGEVVKTSSFKHMGFIPAR